MNMPDFRLSLRWLALGLLSLLPAASVSQSIAPLPQAQRPAMPNVGWMAVNRSPKALLDDHRRLTAALAALKAQRKGIVDAYVVSVALDADAVFGREARETARVLERRYDAAGRTLTLAEGTDGKGVPGSPGHLATALARIAELMDEREDVLVLYTTSHGLRTTGLAYKDPARGYGAIPPDRLVGMLNDLGIGNRLVMISACYSGVFVPVLASDTSVVISAAAADRPSFGCASGNDWTFFGDAMINRALRKPQALGVAFAEAGGLLTQWETRQGLGSSNPQISIGRNADRWLSALEKRMPAQASKPVGQSPAAGG
jgi:hypothetical protein